MSQADSETSPTEARCATCGNDRIVHSQGASGHAFASQPEAERTAQTRKELEWLYRPDGALAPPADERIANVEQALREAEARHAKELAEERYTRCLYLKVWMERNGGPLRITQDDLRDAAEEMKAGSRLTFEVEEDGETLRIGEAQ